MDTKTLIRTIYQRHNEALRTVGGDTWCDLQAAQLSLHLALTELAAQIDAAPPPARVVVGLDIADLLQTRMLAIEDRLAALQDELAHRNGQVKVTTGGEPWLAQSTGTLTANGEEQQALNSPATEPTPDDDFHLRCIAEMRRLAINGTACRKETWNELRQDLPDANNVLAILHMSWNELIAAAGLRRSAGRPNMPDRVRPAPHPTFADEIERHIADGAEPVEESERYATHLEASAERTVVHHGKLPTGEPVRVTATHYMLR